MSENKTKQSAIDVNDFIRQLPEKYRADCQKLVEIMQTITNESPVIWGDTMVGFGRYAYQYASGHGGEWFLTGFAARKQGLSIYIMPGFEPFNDIMNQLGKHKTGRSCLYVNKLADINEASLTELISASVDLMRKRYP